MIADAIGKIQALEQTLADKTGVYLNVRLNIRRCLSELREISAHALCIPTEPALELCRITRPSAAPGVVRSEQLYANIAKR